MNFVYSCDGQRIKTKRKNVSSTCGVSTIELVVHFFFFPPRYFFDDVENIRQTAAQLITRAENNKTSRKQRTIVRDTRVNIRILQWSNSTRTRSILTARVNSIDKFFCSSFQIGSHDLYSCEVWEGDTSSVACSVHLFTTRKVCPAIFTMKKKKKRMEQRVCLTFCVTNGEYI